MPAGAVWYNDATVKKTIAAIFLVLAGGLTTPASTLTVRQFRENPQYAHPVRIRGVVTSVAVDDLDDEWNWLVLNSDTDRLAAAIRETDCPLSELRTLVDADVSLDGLPCRGTDLRSLLGDYLAITNRSGIRVHTPAPADPFAAPLLGQGDPAHRQRIDGIVLGYGDQAIIILPSNGFTALPVHLQTPRPPLPAVGTPVTAVGFVTRGYKRFHLSDALIRVNAAPRETPPPPCAVGPKELFKEGTGITGVGTRYFHQVIRIQGDVRSVADDGAGHYTLLLGIGRHELRVDLSACPDLPLPALGTRLDVTGVCSPTFDHSPAAVFPRFTGLVVYPRGPGDLVVLRTPSWWTPGRLLAVIGILAAALLGILVWNLLLIRRSERRAGELVRERLARARADFRIGERTRLAVELHDSLSQSLSGASLQITASKCLRDSDPSAAAEHLDIAERILKSSRTELRRCLGDLRSDMLEDADFEHALRQAIAPVAASADCRVSFPVARTALPDTTAHAILRIVRELTANAVVHGRAARVDITGSLRDDVLAFSVTDDGAGFDVARRAGPEQGHFGLDGIAERVRHLNGVFEITSTPGRGTKAAITLHV